MALVTKGIVVNLSDGAGSDTELSYEFGEEELLVGPDQAPRGAIEEFIIISTAPQFERLEERILPVPALPRQFGLTGKWRPFSGTFATSQPATSNQSLSLVRNFLESELSIAESSKDPAYLALPQNLPERVALLAAEITVGRETPYLKAKAISEFLNTEYSVASPKSNDASPQAPPTADPMD